MKQYVFFLFFFLLALTALAQRPRPGYGFPINDRALTPPDTNMVLVSKPLRPGVAQPGAFWEYPSLLSWVNNSPGSGSNYSTLDTVHSSAIFTVPNTYDKVRVTADVSSNDVVITLPVASTVPGMQVEVNFLGNSALGVSLVNVSGGSSTIVDENLTVGSFYLFSANTPKEIVFVSEQYTSGGGYFWRSIGINQTLSISGNVLSISGGNSVSIPTGGGGGSLSYNLTFGAGVSDSIAVYGFAPVYTTGGVVTLANTTSNTTLHHYYVAGSSGSATILNGVISVSASYAYSAGTFYYLTDSGTLSTTADNDGDAVDYIAAVCYVVADLGGGNWLIDLKDQPHFVNN